MGNEGSGVGPNVQETSSPGLPALGGMDHRLAGAGSNRPGRRCERYRAVRAPAQAISTAVPRRPPEHVPGPPLRTLHRRTTFRPRSRLGPRNPRTILPGTSHLSRAQHGPAGGFPRNSGAHLKLRARKPGRGYHKSSPRPGTHGPGVDRSLSQVTRLPACAGGLSGGGHHRSGKRTQQDAHD